MKLRIKRHEIGLWFRHGEYRALLEPGTYWLPARMLGWDRVLVFNTLETEFTNPLVDLLLEDPALREKLLVLDLTETQRAIVWKSGRIHGLYGPGRRTFWNVRKDLEVEVFSTDEPLFRHRCQAEVLVQDSAYKFLSALTVDLGERALFHRDGELLEIAGPGCHAYWDSGRLNVRKVDLREQVADVAGQEIMTRDKVTLRIHMIVGWAVRDPVQFVTVSSDGAQAIYRQAQLALREAVGTRDLESVLTDKDQLGREIHNSIADRADELGARLASVGIRDVILPGEMKTILNQVIEARKQAEANVIRRREEIAAAKSQVQTAKMLAENPALVRMKELEALPEILKHAKATLFLGGQGNLMGQVKRLIAEESIAGDADA